MILSREQIEKAFEAWQEENEKGTNTFSSFEEMTAEEKTNILFYYARMIDIKTPEEAERYLIDQGVDLVDYMKRGVKDLNVIINNLKRKH